MLNLNCQMKVLTYSNLILYLFFTCVLWLRGQPTVRMIMSYGALVFHPNKHFQISLVNSKHKRHSFQVLMSSCQKVALMRAGETSRHWGRKQWGQGKTGVVWGEAWLKAGRPWPLPLPSPPGTSCGGPRPAHFPNSPHSQGRALNHTALLRALAGTPQGAAPLTQAHLSPSPNRIRPLDACWWHRGQGSYL